jgi:hypothetical protein
MGTAFVSKDTKKQTSHAPASSLTHVALTLSCDLRGALRVQVAPSVP